jgi:hypothetical protein
MICKGGVKKEIEFSGNKEVVESAQFFAVENRRYITKLLKQTLILALCGRHWYFVCNEKNAQKPFIYVDENFLIQTYRIDFKDKLIFAPV